MGRRQGTAATDWVLIREQVGTKHDSRPPCALCTALLAEGVTGEGWPMGSILDTPELAEILALHHSGLSNQDGQNRDVVGS
jgi:hypothetical protein